MRRYFAAAMLLGSGLLMAGCAGPIVGLAAVEHVVSIASLTSTALVGKGLGEHAMDIATGGDCRLLEGVVRADRSVCEVRYSAPTDKDFKGIVGMMVADGRGVPLLPSARELAAALAGDGASPPTRLAAVASAPAAAPEPTAPAPSVVRIAAVAPSAGNRTSAALPTSRPVLRQSEWDRLSSLAAPGDLDVADVPDGGRPMVASADMRGTNLSQAIGN